MAPVHPVDLVAVGDVEVRRLLGLVAVARGHGPGEGDEGRVVARRHVGGDVDARVAVRPQHELAVRVERDVRPDLLDAVHHAAVHEVTERPGLRGRERLRAAVDDGRRVAGGAAAAAEAVVVVAVEVRADGRAAGVRLAVLAPGAERGAGQVVPQAVGVQGEDDEGLPGLDEAGDRRVGAVAAGQPAQDGQGLFGGEVLPGVVEGVDQDLGLGLVRGHVVADLGDPDVAALVALADREDRHDVGVVLLRPRDLGDQLGPVVVAGHRGREVRARPRRRRARARWPGRRARRRGTGQRGSDAWLQGCQMRRDRGTGLLGYRGAPVTPTCRPAQAPPGRRAPLRSAEPLPSRG